MGAFERKSVDANKIGIKRIEADMRVPMGAGEVKYLQPVAQNKTDGLFYAYEAGDENKGIIAGIYTGEDRTFKAKEIGAITTQAIVAKESIHGITWTDDHTAISALKLAGIILTEEIKGTKEA